MSRCLVNPHQAWHLRNNLARNCLVHRNGIVSHLDSNSDQGLVVKWRKLEIMATGPGGERVMTAMARVKAGESVFLRHAKDQKLFRKGEFVTFTVDEFGELCMTLFSFGQQLVQNKEQYGRSKGVRFDAPGSNAIGQSDTSVFLFYLTLVSIESILPQSSSVGGQTLHTRQFCSTTRYNTLTRVCRYVK